MCHRKLSLRLTKEQKAEIAGMQNKRNVATEFVNLLCTAESLLDG